MRTKVTDLNLDFDATSAFKTHAAASDGKLTQDGQQMSSLLSSNEIISSMSQQSFQMGALRRILGPRAAPENFSISHVIVENPTDTPECSVSSYCSTTYSTSTQDSNDTASDESDGWCSPLEWQHQFILEAVMTEFYNLFRRFNLNRHINLVYGNPRSSNSGQSGSWKTQSSSSTNQSSLLSSTCAIGPKRLGGDGSFPPPDEDRVRNKRPRISLDNPGYDDNTRRFACPFFKNDPSKFNQRGQDGSQFIESSMFSLSHIHWMNLMTMLIV